MGKKHRKKQNSTLIIPNSEMSASIQENAHDAGTKNVSETLQGDAQTNQREEFSRNTGAIPKVRSVKAAENSEKGRKKRNRRKKQVADEVPLYSEEPSPDNFERFNNIYEACKGNKDEIVPELLSKAYDLLDNTEFLRDVLVNSLAISDVKGKQHVPLGKAIWEAAPLVYVMNQNENVFRCDRCLFKRENLRPCENCEFASYCSPECEKEALKIHKYECEKLRNLGTAPITDRERYLGLLVMIVNDAKSDDIWNHMECVNVDISQMFGEECPSSKELHETFEFLQKYLGEKDMPTLSKYKTIYTKARCETLNIIAGTDAHVGLGLYLGQNFFQHSCSPNAIISFVGPIIRITSLDNIPFDEIQQVTIDRFKMIDTRQFKQQYFKQHYNINCQCSKQCTNPVFYKVTEEATDEAFAAKYGPIIDISLHNVRKDNPVTTDDLKNLLEECKSILDFVSRGYTEYNVKRLQVLQVYAKYHFMGNIDRSTQSLNNECLRVSRFYFGKIHPYVAHILFRTAYVLMLLENANEAKVTFMYGINVIGIAYGTDHPFHKRMSSVLLYCNQQQWRFGQIVSHYPYSFDDY